MSRIPIETSLERIAALTEQHRDDNQAFGHYIDIMWERERRSDAELDALIDEIAAGVIPHIDCTACANCCRSMAVGLTPDDIPPLTRATGLSPETIINRYVDRKAAAPWGEWGVFCDAPCPFLRGMRCSVYANRPDACRDYPTLTPNFRWLYDEIKRGAGKCPIVFNVIERLKQHLGW